MASKTRTGLKGAMKKIAKPLAAAPLHIGIDLKKIANFKHLPRYLSQKKQFMNLGGEVSRTYPVLSDYAQSAGSARGHYFHQDLLVASFINKANPNRHIDIGSRIDGFVAHVASFRKIEVMDIRALSDTGHENISFMKADLMKMDNANENITDSISCLHAIEHFGLGRYGDSLDPEGHKKGFNNILRMLKADGTLYISFPIGNSNEVHFNAHRVFHPQDVFRWASDTHAIKLKRFDYVDDAGNLHQDVSYEFSFGPEIRLRDLYFQEIRRTLELKNRRSAHGFDRIYSFIILSALLFCQTFTELTLKGMPTPEPKIKNMCC